MKTKNEELECVNLKFILKHIKTGIEIEMPYASICDEYSHLAFSTDEESENFGIDMLPTGGTYLHCDDITEYIVYAIINEKKFILNINKQ